MPSVAQKRRETEERARKSFELLCDLMEGTVKAYRKHNKEFSLISMTKKCAQIRGQMEDFYHERFRQEHGFQLPEEEQELWDNVLTLCHRISKARRNKPEYAFAQCPELLHTLINLNGFVKRVTDSIVENSNG